MPAEWQVLAVVAVLVAGWLARRKMAWLLAAMALPAAVSLFARAHSRLPPAPVPVRIGASGYVSSGACRSCHPSEHASWFSSFHRTMTQAASLDHVASPRLRAGGRLHVEADGRTIELFARSDELWARLPDPGITSATSPEGFAAAFRSAPARDVRVVLVTGSHHQQAFWVEGARDGELRALPSVYLTSEARLIPRRDAFLTPPDAEPHQVRWNSNCIQCHAVAGAPRHEESTNTFSSSAAELGIACEACHGPGQQHVEAMRSPWRRYRAHEGNREDLQIVNPPELSPERGSEVCGRCHSYFVPKDPESWWATGFSSSFQPGDELSKAQTLLTLERLSGSDAPALDENAESLFYADGTIRVGGREYNGLLSSPCFERGSAQRKLSCFSCHSMHDSDPNDQLGKDKDGDAACTQCHERQGRDPSAHTGHAVTSSGSRCYSCHMPRTTYALLGAIRSHRIDSPRFDARTRDRPNACNLCHLERSEAWAAESAARKFGDGPAYVLSRSPQLSSIDAPAGAVYALAGDAAVRAVVAAALGRADGPNSSVALRRQLLEELARDPYAAVRHIAERALGSQPESARVVTPPLRGETISRLKALRDNRPITIAE